MIFREGHDSERFPSSAAARVFLLLLGLSLRSIASHKDRSDQAPKDFVWELLDDLENRIDEIEDELSKHRLSPDDFVDLRHMHDAMKNQMDQGG